MIKSHQLRAKADMAEQTNGFPILELPRLNFGLEEYSAEEFYNDSLQRSFYKTKLRRK